MNIKSDKNRLLELIGDDIITYLLKGQVNINPYLRDINSNIVNIEKLVKIHFLLDEEVTTYLNDLKENIKKFNTSTYKESSITHGSIKGSISWNKTITKRANINPKDKTIFVCSENSKNYNTKENLVLKTLLEVFCTLLNDKDLAKYKEYKEIDVKSINKLYKKNIYLSRVDLKSLKLNDRAINDVCKNRNILYGKSAKLLKRYRKLMALDKNEIENLFRKTFIEIADEDTLFELFWIFKILKSIESKKILHVIDGKNNLVAQWEDEEKIYEIYHNSIGSKELSFKVSRDEVRDIKNTYIEKELEVVDKTNNIAKSLFPNIGERYTNLYNGRPDILIEVRNKANKRLEKVIIGEVKHTNRMNYAIQGLKELLEYMNFIKVKNEQGLYDYLENDTIKVKGILFLDNIDLKEYDKLPIKVFTMNNIEEKEIKIL